MLEFVRVASALRNRSGLGFSFALVCGTIDLWCDGFGIDCLWHATRTMLMIIDSLYTEASPTITIVFVLDKAQTIHQHLLVLIHARSLEK
jgi:hypothetical protein